MNRPGTAVRQRRGRANRTTRGVPFRAVALAGVVLAGGVLSGGVLSGGVLSGGVLSGGVTAKPSHVFNFTDWTLTLPVDSHGGTGGTRGSEFAARTVHTRALVEGFHDRYFALNKNGGLVFTDPSNGATTTPGKGSNHTRAELHEYYEGPDALSDGCWDSALGGELSGHAVVDRLSVDSDEATIAQIHGKGSAAFTLLELRAHPEQLVIVTYREPDSGNAHQTVLLPHISLGQQIDFELRFKDGLVTATANGVTKSVHAGRWEHYPVRFDLGAYSSAPNVGNPAGDATQVTYLSFAVSH